LIKRNEAKKNQGHNWSPEKLRFMDLPAGNSIFGASSKSNFRERALLFPAVAHPFRLFFNGLQLCRISRLVPALGVTLALLRNSALDIRYSLFFWISPAYARSPSSRQAGIVRTNDFISAKPHKIEVSRTCFSTEFSYAGGAGYHTLPHSSA
jgi:hypothetical protein